MYTTHVMTLEFPEECREPKAVDEELSVTNERGRGGPDQEAFAESPSRRLRKAKEMRVLT